MKTVVPLSRTYEAHGKAHREITVREPTGMLLLEFGEPRQVVYAPNGVPFLVENKAEIRSYLEAVCEPGPEVLMQLGVADYRAVKEALFGFFSVAGKGSTDSSTTSSSA